MKIGHLVIQKSHTSSKLHRSKCNIKVNLILRSNAKIMILLHNYCGYKIFMYNEKLVHKYSIM